MFNEKTLTEEEEKKILDLFYRTELERGEIRIDNSDPYISKKTGILKGRVERCITRHLDHKFRIIRNRHETRPE